MLEFILISLLYELMQMLTNHNRDDRYFFNNVNLDIPNTANNQKKTSTFQNATNFKSY